MKIVNSKDMSQLFLDENKDYFLLQTFHIYKQQKVDLDRCKQQVPPSEVINYRTSTSSGIRCPDVLRSFRRMGVHRNKYYNINRLFLQKYIIIFI